MSKEENARHSDKAAKDNTATFSLTVPSPKDIKKYLDEYIIGQDDVKIALSVAVHNHYRRIQAKIIAQSSGVTSDVEIEKSNVLMTGPTGTGKTLLAKTLARMLGVPFAIADATTLTQAGYVGEDVENVVRYLWQNSGYNERLAEIGIIYVDEIDKIASKTDNVSITRDVSGEGVQQALLKIVEGTVCRFPPNGGRKHPDQQLVEVDTTNILFICGGAFVGLDKVIESRSGRKNLGFIVEHEEDEDLDTDPQPGDFIKFGLIPEFIGRLPVVVSTKDLSEDDLVHILKEPKNSLVKQYEKLFSFDGITIRFEDSALRAIAKSAVRRKTGARGLRAEFEKIMTGVMYEYAGSGKKTKLSIDEKFIESRLRGKKRQKDAA